MHAAISYVVRVFLYMTLKQARVMEHPEYPERVFTYEGKPVRYVNTKAWRNALKLAGIAEFRWHDLRHTWASWLIQNGTPLYDLQEMGGWTSAAMVLRYAHLAPAHMARQAAVVDGLLRVSSTAQ